MNQWIQRIEGHQVFIALGTVVTAAESAQARAQKATPDQVEALVRIPVNVTADSGRT